MLSGQLPTNKLKGGHKINYKAKKGKKKKEKKRSNINKERER